MSALRSMRMATTSEKLAPAAAMSGVKPSLSTWLTNLWIKAGRS